MSPVLFSIISEKKMQDILDTLHQFTGLSIQLLDADGESLMCFGKPNGYCSLIKKHLLTQNECQKLYHKSALRSQSIGQTYIFTCHANLNLIAFPLIQGANLLAGIIVGPFLMDSPDSTLVLQVAQKHELPVAFSLELYDELGRLPVLPPDRVQILSRLIDHLLSPLLESEQVFLLINKEKLFQQSKINETIQMYKGLEKLPNQSYLYEQENILLRKVRTGNIAEAKAVLNDLLGFVFFTEGGQPDSIKARAIELSALLSRVALEGGAQGENVYSLNSTFLTKIGKTDSFEGMCYLMQEIVESFMDSAFYNMDKGNPYIRQALSYISQKYAEQLTLDSVAKKVGLSANYFSSIFHQVTGLSFREHLNHVRIEESKRLLKSTEYTLADISAAVGFSDQSYFSKIFRAETGFTPGQYRSGYSLKNDDR